MYRFIYAYEKLVALLRAKKKISGERKCDRSQKRIYLSHGRIVIYGAITSRDFLHDSRDLLRAQLTLKYFGHSAIDESAI